ncbi:hypothetical protein UZ36_02985 [Candidatus Nitromaritima sp. SCGC AAA799-C22]|nr:hypothetical protein UZ36_02985 [Candidatus Nitromaritima sp. SCGC AAA799-C22]
MWFVLVFFLMAAAPALAEEDLLEVLRDNKTITDEQYEKLKKKQKDREISRHGKGFQFGADDGNFKLKLGGRVQVDAAVYDDNRDLGDGTELRRARLGVAATLFRHWKLEAGYEFAGDSVSVKDAWIGYTGIQSTLLRAGHFKEPFSLEELTSSKYSTFMERGLPNAFVPGRNIGIGSNIHGENWSFATGVFGEGAGDARTEGEGFGVTGRITFAPLARKERAVHLGLAGTFRAPEEVTDSVTFNSRPESHVTSARLVDTGAVGNVNHFTLIGVEAATVLDAFSLQGEYIRARVSRGENNPGVNFEGAYIYASWFLTGESRTYSPKKGIFGNVVPQKDFGPDGIGAWELALRYSFLDLNDGPVVGGQEENITAGLNWNVNSRIRFMANYVRVMTGPNRGDNDSNIFQMRAQAFF